MFTPLTAAVFLYLLALLYTLILWSYSVLFELVKLNSIWGKLTLFFWNTDQNPNCSVIAAVLLTTRHSLKTFSKLSLKKASIAAMHASTHLQPTISAPSTPVLCQTSAIQSGTASALSHSPAATLLLMLITESDSDEHMPILMHTATHTAVPHHHQPDSDSSSDHEYFVSHTTHASLTIVFHSQPTCCCQTFAPIQITNLACKSNQPHCHVYLWTRVPRFFWL